MSNNYVYLKNLQGEVIKPITDLSAINLTPGNGIGVTGDTIGITDGYVASATFESLTDPATAANPDSSYISGNTMFTLIGGYTVTDEIPPISGASHEKVPSEYSVRSAIDALATLGPSMAPGAGIVVETVSGGTGGTISVAEGNGINVATAQQGGVSVKAAANGGLSVTSDGVAVSAGNGITVGTSGVEVKAKADGGVTVDNDGVSLTYPVSGATNGVKVVSGVVQADTGDGLVIESGAVAIDDASVKDVLTGATVATISGTTNTRFLGIMDEVVTPGNLRGALSIGQAVDVSCKPRYTGPAVPTVDGAALTDQNFLGTMAWAFTAASTTTVGLGFTSSYKFPKYANGLKYLFVLDIKNVGSTSVVMQNYMNGHPYDGIYGYVGDAVKTLNENDSMHLAGVFSDLTSASIGIKFGVTSGSDYSFEITNWRQYEVTALTDEAIQYLAQVKNPDAFFREANMYNTTTGNIRDKYLVKQDMVCPFIPIIGMTNSDLTIAAGLAYQMQLTGSTTYHFSADTIPTNGYGWDSHLQLFIGANSMVSFDPPLSLMNPLTPNAGHNITIKWRAGQALAYVDDTDVGYVVSITTGSSNGTLAYGLSTDTGEYIVFSEALSGQTCSAGTSSITINRDVNLLGNGTESTIISFVGGPASGKKINIQNLSISGSTINGAGTVALNGIAVSGESYIMVSTASNALIDSCTVISGGTLHVPRFTRVGEWIINGELKVDGTDTRGELYVGNSSHASISGNGVVTAAIYRVSSSYLTSYAVDISGVTFNIGGGLDALGGVWTYKNVVINVNKTGINHDSGAVLIADSAGVVYLNGVAINIDSSSADNTEYVLSCRVGGTMIIHNCVVTRPQVFTVRGTIIIDGRFQYSGYTAGADSNPTISIYDNSTIDMHSTLSTSEVSTKSGTGVFTIGNNVTFLFNNGTQGLIDGCVINEYTNTGKFSNANGAITITGSTVDPWKATNVIFASPLDASAASTIKLTGTTFTSASKISAEPMRIQLTAATTVSVRGNTSTSDTKILSAPLIMVGDAPSSSTTATIEYGTNNTSSISGLGTFIKQDGSNDFSNDITNVTTSNGLGTALAGANRWVKIGNGTVTSMVGSADVVDRRIITNEYEPIIGGTYTVLTGGTMTVNEEAKTATIAGGSIALVNVNIAKGATLITSGGLQLKNNALIEGAGILDLAGYRIDEYGKTIVISGCSITNGMNNFLQLYASAKATVKDCTFVYNGTELNAIFGNMNTTTITVNGGNFDNGLNILLQYGVLLNLIGNIKMKNAIKASVDGGTVTVSSGAVLDFTDNSNPVVINASTHGIIFEPGGATVYPSAGSASAYVLDGMTIPQIGNTNVIDLGGTRVTVATDALVSGATITNGGASSFFGSGGSATLTMVDCTVVGNASPAIHPVGQNRKWKLSNCTVSGSNTLYVYYGASCTLIDCNVDSAYVNNQAGEYMATIFLSGSNTIGTIKPAFNSGSVIISSGASINLTNSIAPGGGITVLEGGCTVNGNTISAGTYTSIDSNGSATV